MTNQVEQLQNEAIRIADEHNEIPVIKLINFLQASGNELLQRYVVVMREYVIAKIRAHRIRRAWEAGHTLTDHPSAYYGLQIAVENRRSTKQRLLEVLEPDELVVMTQIEKRAGKLSTF